MKKIIAVCLVFVFSAVAFADQAAYITKSEAEKAFNLLNGKKQIKHHCAPCEDKSIKTEDIQTVEMAETGYENTWEVKINGKGVDLAYIYFETKKGKWKNVAEELDIEVEDVPEFLPKDKETE